MLVREKKLQQHLFLKYSKQLSDVEWKENKMTTKFV